MSNHHIVPGSFETNGEVLTACLHTGPSEWEIRNQRFVQGNIKDSTPGDTILSFLGRIYDNSEGCLVLGNFKMKDQNT